MGFTSVLVFNNDCLHDTEKKSLHDVWSEASADHNRGLENAGWMRRSIYGVSMPWNEHSDGYCLMLVGGCQGKVLTTTFDASRSGPPNMDKIELTLLEDLAKKHGFSLRRRHTKKEKSK